MGIALRSAAGAGPGRHGAVAAGARRPLRAARGVPGQASPALVAAGILHAASGPNGGYQLGKPAAEISALDVLDAVEGAASPFVCQEIRQQGTSALPPEQCTRPCAIAVVMAQAHLAWRASLRGVTVADLVERLPEAVQTKIRSELS